MQLLATFILLGAVGLAQTVDRSLWPVPAAAAAKPNPLKDKLELAAGGKKVFEKSCAICHASKPGQKGPDLSIPAIQQESDGAIFWKLSTGNSRSGMPGFSSMPKGQRWQLVLYIRSLAHQGVD